MQTWMCQGKGQVWQKELILLQLIHLKTNFFCNWAGTWAGEYSSFCVSGNVKALVKMKSLAGANPFKGQALPWICHKEQVCVSW